MSFPSLWVIALALGFPPAAGPRTLTVLAAASLQEAFTALGDSLEHRRPGLTVAFSFSGSQTLALQILQGAPADVFASADDRWMTVVRDSGLLLSEPRTFARNHLVVIVPASNPGHVSGLLDLGRSGVKLVLAADAVPAGRYARTVAANLAKLDGFGADFAARFERNIVSNEENVKSVVTKVRLGEADAGIVYGSDVTEVVAADVRTIGIPPTANVIANYPIAILARAPDRDDAVAFVELVLSPAGQRVLARLGFTAVS
ncbi:MAG TPA: molybdate ABC transporter substrate-binding protein, partial [Gemmatimonadales bacterium]|nr:molybdate ABC transporter substrate-binding protein [Gemmatimonadales bacterium]